MLNYASKYPTQTTTPDADYPLGGAQNVVSPGDGTGTPWDEALINDVLGFFQALTANTSITVSGNAETAVASDLWDAIDNLYALYNANKLIKNDATATPGDAEIGKAYQGKQYYGQSAAGHQYYGRLATGIQYYGLFAIGDQYYGLEATGAIEIGSTVGSAATKKLISGAKEATFEEIIDVATAGWGAWQTISYNTGTAAPVSTNYRSSMVCRKASDGKNVQISGAFNHTSGTSVIGTLPSGYRPANTVGFSGQKATASGTSCQMFADSNGEIRIFNWDTNDVVFEIIIPLD